MDWTVTQHITLWVMVGLVFPLPALLNLNSVSFYERPSPRRLSEMSIREQKTSELKHKM